MSSCSTTDSIITTEVVPEVLPPGSRTEDAIIGATSATSIGNYDSDDDDLPPLLLVHSDNDDSEFVLYRRRVAVLLAVESINYCRFIGKIKSNYDMIVL